MLCRRRGKKEDEYMAKMKKATAWVLCAATVLSCASCSGSNASGGDTSSTTAPNNSGVMAETTTTIDDDIDNPVDVGDVTVDIGVDKEEIEPCTLKYVGNYDITTAGDIKPSVKYLEENYGCNIECKIVGSNVIMEEIAKLVQSGDSPDLMDKNDSTYPHWMSKNMYVALDDYIDLSLPQWAGLEEIIDSYEWNGKHYYYPFDYTVAPYSVIYNRGLFEEKGLDDPYELYRAGEWTWDKFKELMIDFVGDDKDSKVGFYGYFFTGFINSNGTSLISTDENGKLVNNLKSTKVEEAMNFLQSLRKEGLTNPEILNVDENPIVDGTAAFQIMGGWIFTNYAKRQKKNDSLDFFFVPIPRSDDSDEYYHSLSTFGYLIPEGSEHVKQAATFINCCRMSKVDPELKEVTKQSEMKNKKYTEEMYDFLVEFRDPTAYNCIIEEYCGFSTDTVELIKTMMNNCAFDTSAEQQSWTQMRDENYNVIQEQVDFYNAAMAS